MKYQNVVVHCDNGSMFMIFDTFELDLGKATKSKYTNASGLDLGNMRY